MHNPSTRFDNIVEIRSTPPGYLDEALPHSAWVPVINDLEWWNIVPGHEPPPYDSWTTHEEDGRILEIHVETKGQTMREWARAVAYAHPSLCVSLSVNDGETVRWHGTHCQYFGVGG